MTDFALEISGGTLGNNEDCALCGAAVKNRFRCASFHRRDNDASSNGETISRLRNPPSRDLDEKTHQTENSKDETNQTENA